MDVVENLIGKNVLLKLKNRKSVKGVLRCLEHIGLEHKGFKGHKGLHHALIVSASKGDLIINLKSVDSVVELCPNLDIRTGNCFLANPHKEVCLNLHNNILMNFERCFDYQRYGVAK